MCLTVYYGKEIVKTERSSIMEEPQVVGSKQQYEGKYVALRSFRDNTIIAFGEKAHKVASKAIKKGAVEPVIVFIPKPIHKYGVSCIY
jgi:hypothetical protein